MSVISGNHRKCIEAEKKFEVGEPVKVCERSYIESLLVEKDGHRYMSCEDGRLIYFNPCMMRFCGSIQIVKDIIEDCVYLDNTRYTWTKDMLEKCQY